MNIGDKAPEVLGKDEQGRDIRLSDYKGRKLVLYFYPKDNTSGCTAEACSLRDHYSELQGKGYEVVGLLTSIMSYWRRWVPGARRICMARRRWALFVLPLLLTKKALLSRSFLVSR